MGIRDTGLLSHRHGQGAGQTLHRDPSLDEGQRPREMSHGLWQKLGPQDLRVESAAKFNGKPNLLHLCKLAF